ncbi:MAG: regulatory protein RecX [Prevotellamassilia sp.]
MDFYLWASARCSTQECCPSDIASKLKTKGATSEEIEDILHRLEAEGFLNEDRFAQAFTNDKARFDGWGRIKIRYSLRQKGISESAIDEALSNLSETDYLNRLLDFIQSKRRTTRGDSPYAIRQKIARSAITRGYEPPLVFKALELEEYED